ncbi:MULTISPECIES: 2Fe-2S iron-sulfur cluster binding domain-containing protein [Mycobacterium]|uniref:Ferredoxin n=1 Tax=Mycobacterium colombiense TaxID=339268 RepID=A0A329M1R3_9MYCO|nr:MULTISPECIES: 2Fe-2S iron-sulfur cluster binding domain-containing protein [Mycobacterium]MDM4141974.1 2Fe-2S iron-sulfur cluster binding domain-containing protein [Mycobacterium sp. FLAC0960]RAV10857.1 ferredoxin [Mycobacterium colombiense]
MPDATRLEVELDGRRHRLGWPPGQTLVETLLDAGIAVPHSCREGRCGSCVATVAAGRVDMAPCDVLDAADLEDGLILACQARAAGVEVHVEF